MAAQRRVGTLDVRVHIHRLIPTRIQQPTTQLPARCQQQQQQQQQQRRSLSCMTWSYARYVTKCVEAGRLLPPGPFEVHQGAKMAAGNQVLCVRARERERALRRFVLGLRSTSSQVHKSLCVRKPQHILHARYRCVSCARTCAGLRLKCYAPPPLLTGAPQHWRQRRAATGQGAYSGLRALVVGAPPPPLTREVLGVLLAAGGGCVVAAGSCGGLPANPSRRQVEDAVAAGHPTLAIVPPGTPQTCVWVCMHVMV
jgi:hypothetical protein